MDDLTNCPAGADPGFDQGGPPDRDRPKTAILGPQFCRILVLGPHIWWSGGGPGPRGPPGSAPGPVCFESYEETGDHLPRLLPCTHTLCHTCVSAMIHCNTLVCHRINRHMLSLMVLQASIKIDTFWNI